MNNEEAKRLIRKYSDIISTCVYGIIVLVLWNIVKSVIYINDVLPLALNLNAQSFEQLNLTLVIIFFVIQSIIAIIVSILAKSKMKKNKNFGLVFLVLGTILSLLVAIYVVNDVVTFFQIQYFDSLLFVATLSDALYLSLTISLIVYSIKLVNTFKVLPEVANER